MSDWKKGAAFLTDLQAARSSSIHGLSKDWSKVHGYYRFLRNDRVSEPIIINKLLEQCYEQVTGQDVIAIADTTEVNCQAHHGRLRSTKDLGPLSDHHTWGYLMHPVYCVNEKTNYPLGIANVRLWNRSWSPIGDAYHGKCITEKESDKWFTDLIRARENALANARHITFVMDREADHFDVLCHVPDHRTDIVIRNRHNRKILLNGKTTQLKEHLLRQPSQGCIRLQLPPHNSIRRMTVANVKWSSVTICKPQHNRPHPPNTPDHVTMHVVEVKEKRKRGEDRLWWTLVTSKPVKNIEQAMEIIDIYKRRWQIEEIFRLMKTESFNIENSALGHGDCLRKLGLFILEASVKVAQLKASRDEESPIRTDSIFSPSEIQCLKHLNEDLQGNTVKLSNPFSDKSLSWASWIIARLGGWKGYQSQRPPGSITFKRGLEIFDKIHLGFSIVNRDVYKR